MALAREIGPVAHEPDERRQLGRCDLDRTHRLVAQPEEVARHPVRDLLRVEAFVGREGRLEQASRVRIADEHVAS